MRLDKDQPSSLTGTTRPLSNGSSAGSQQKSATSNSTNGLSHHPEVSNGSAPVKSGVSGRDTLRNNDYFGHDREEVTRILVQSLTDLGYNGAAAALSRESGYDVESTSVAAFRNAVIQGEWAEAEGLLFGDQLPEKGTDVESRYGRKGAGLILAEGADKKEMLFWMRQQKFLELLEGRDLGSALMVLRQELTPLHQDIGKLHALSSLIMCQSADDLKTQADWDGAAGQSRQVLLSELSKSISPSVMIPEHRLAVLLQRVKQNQISNCLYHNTTTSPSLYSDHLCDRSQFPLEIMLELDRHTDEVWFLEFSHDGTMLSTTGQDKTVVIYDVGTFEPLHILAGHGDHVAYTAWSPDDTKLISCCHDRLARIWDVESGTCLVTVEHHAQPVTTCAWAPDGQTFVTGSLDRQAPLCVSDLQGALVHAWTGMYRVRDCSMTRDGRRLVVLTTENRILVFDYKTRAEEYSIALKVDLTCISTSADSRYMLVNMADNEIQLLDIETTEVTRRFMGQKQGRFVIRSSFGGAGENFVISGSEDSRVYIWHKENGTLLETLDGHQPGCVNAVSWNPRNPSMFASAGDDHKVRIWSKASDVKLLRDRDHNLEG
ncbi:MAG: hypothetical protein M1825_005818 [Sarcosagium campestre]|nr:MAG: hypothetical protein M1825_005818 [Sarcosagium campestre]